jgi:hypothetical protein
LSPFSEYAPPALRNKWKPAATIKLIQGAKPHESSASGGYNAQPSAPNRARRFIAHSYFEVKGCHAGKRYRIRHGMGTNVYELDAASRPRAGWCFVPKDNLVAGDVMLAQKIALETDERGALAVANNFTPSPHDSAFRGAIIQWLRLTRAEFLFQHKMTFIGRVSSLRFSISAE